MPSGGSVAPYRISRKDPPHTSVHEAEIALFGHVFLLVHGYNDSQSDAEDAYAAMIKNLDQAELFDKTGGTKAILYFQWPGDYALVPGVPSLDALAYVDDLNLAKQAFAELARFLNNLCACGNQTQKFSIICHSMGGRILLEALFRLKQSFDIDVVAMMAAAVPTELVDSANGPAAYLSGLDRPPRQFRKYHSWIDVVLGIAFPAGELLSFYAGAETAAYAQAVGWLGNPSSFGIEPPDTGLHAHWSYWDNVEVAYDIATSIEPACRDSPAVRNLPSPYELPSPYDLPAYAPGG